MPDATPDQPKDSQQPRRDGYDKANTFILACTLIAAGLAAGFTGWQASIAQDQERRTLRAYVIVKTELTTRSDGTTPYIKLTAENMGQTPAYNLFFATTAFIEGGSEPERVRYIPIDCREDAAHQREVSEGQTFSKEAFTGSGISSFIHNIKTMNEAFGDSQKVVAYGRVCYRDIFREIHSVRLCYEWTSPDYGPDKCRNEQADQDY